MILYLVEKIDLIEGYQSTSQVFDSYTDAVTAFKAKVAEELIFNSYHDYMMVNEMTNKKSDSVTLEDLAQDSVESFGLFTKNGNQIKEIPEKLQDFLADEFIDGCNEEITFESECTIFLLRAVDYFPRISPD